MNWFTADRARAYSRLLAATMLICMLGMVANLAMQARSDPLGRPIATDFAAFRTGAVLAAEGHAAWAYDPNAISAREREGARIGGTGVLPYLYPPVFLLLTLPLALLPYLTSLLVFLAAGYAGMIFHVKRLLPDSWPLLPVLAMPGAMINVVTTQNGFLSAICFAGALPWLQTRPWLAGAYLGAFAYKPHLGICIPVALAAARRWQALGMCGATACGLVALSWLVFGSPAWVAFFHATPVTRAMLETHPEIWSKLVSVYAACRVLHAGLALSLALQGAVACISLLAVARICASRPGAGLETAALVTGTLLCTPYAMDYDLICLAVPIAVLATASHRSGWRNWEKPVCLAAYVLPLFARWLSVFAHVPITPLVLAAMLATLWSRCCSMQAA